MVIISILTVSGLFFCTNFRFVVYQLNFVLPKLHYQHKIMVTLFPYKKIFQTWLVGISWSSFGISTGEDFTMTSASLPRSKIRILFLHATGPEIYFSNIRQRFTISSNFPQNEFLNMQIGSICLELPDWANNLPYLD